MASFVNINYQKKLLSYHGSFKPMEFFRELDSDQQGFLTSASLASYFAQDEDFTNFDFESLVKYWNGSE